MEAKAFRSDVLSSSVSSPDIPTPTGLGRWPAWQQWALVACLSAELPGAGSFRLFDDAGPPILLTRGKDGQVRAFLNACQHKGAKLVEDAKTQPDVQRFVDFLEVSKRGIIR